MNVIYGVQLRLVRRQDTRKEKGIHHLARQCDQVAHCQSSAHIQHSSFAERGIYGRAQSLKRNILQALRSPVGVDVRNRRVTYNCARHELIILKKVHRKVTLNE